MTARLDLGLPARQSLAQSVAQGLLEAIRDGRLAPGEKLPSEAELRAQLEVGRSTIREALNGLVLLGAIEVRHGQGTFVRDPASSGALDGMSDALRGRVDVELLEAREATELAIAQHAAHRATLEDLEQLRALLDATEARIREERPVAEEASRFHLLLAQAAKNRILLRFIENIMGLLEERGEELTAIPGYPEWELAAHRRLLDAVAAGDGDEARREMASHLAAMRTIHLEGWESFRTPDAANE